MLLRLTRQLLRLFAMGVIPGTQVQALAAGAWADGWGRRDDIANRLASAGNDGRHSGNVVRAIFRAATAAGLLT